LIVHRAQRVAGCEAEERHDHDCHAEAPVGRRNRAQGLSGYQDSRATSVSE
jgi:hypothetical protein